jgi:hypothetical protein
MLDGIVGMARSKLPPPQSRSTRMPMQTYASLARHFNLDWLRSRQPRPRTKLGGGN